MLESFGARLRQQREQHGIDLVAIAEQTKIKRSLLEALERDDLSQWPSGIFRRAYVRNYAQAIGLDPDATVQLFLQVHPEAAEVAALAEIASLADGARAPNGSASTRLRTMMGSALGSFSLFRRHASQADDDMPAADPAPQPFGDTAYTLTLRPPVPGTSPFENEIGTLDADAVSEDPPAPIELPEPVTEMAEAVSVEAFSIEHPAEIDAPAEPVKDPEIDLLAVARLCTEFSRVGDPAGMQPQLRACVELLEANGLIVWLWDMDAAGLRPALACGYPERLLAQLPTVARDADNATAEAFRSGHACVIHGDAHASGALVVPLLGPDACLGVLALEFRHGREARVGSRAVATILGAALTQLIERFRPVEAQEAETDAPPTIETPPERVLRTGTRH
jgi:transcriptional regulator with XRE-family HTH domain